MKTLQIAAALLLLAVPCIADDVIIDLDNLTAQAKTITERINSPAPKTPAETETLRKEKEAVVSKITGVADMRPDNPAAQLAVGKSLASVEEAPRAIPYAERGLRLAEASGDKKLIREALLTGSEVFYKAGNYALARERAQRILHQNPKDKDALAMYMQVKDRGAAAPSAPAGGTGEAGSASGAGSAGGGYAPGAAPAASGPAVAMTDAASLEARKQIALGWSRLKLDPKAALKNFEAAITAAPRSAAVRAERSKARLATGDAHGALGDADDAISFDPKLADGYAARYEARRALGLKEEELIADLEAAAKLDPRFAEQYKAMRLRFDAYASAPEGQLRAAGSAAAAPSGPRALLTSSPKGWALLALVVVLSAALGGVIAPLILRRRRSDGDGSPPR